MGGGYYGQGHGIYSNQPYMNQNYQRAWNRPTQPRLHFLATLNLPDLSRFMNDPMPHDLTWPEVPTKIPSYILKFVGKDGEDPGEHATTFQLWCSSNSLHDGSIRLRLFQCTLTSPMVKWYIELPGGAYATFDDLVLTFLNHFQLLVRYDVDTELLSIFRR